MTSILLTLSGKIEKPVVDTLHILKRVADSLHISFFMVGASARDFILKHHYGIEPRRKTGDIDIGLEVASWEQFKTLFESLVSTGRFSPTPERQRLRSGAVLVDILPFGGITGGANAKKRGQIFILDLILPRLSLQPPQDLSRPLSPSVNVSSPHSPISR